MTHPRSNADDSARPAGMGEPVTGMPEMHAPPPPPPVWRPSAAPQAPHVPAPQAPRVPPPPTGPPPAPPRDRGPRRPWLMLGALGVALVLGLVTALVFIGGGDPSVDVAEDSDHRPQCVPPDEPVDAEPLSAEEFYSMDPWESEFYGEAESATRLGVWDHVDCCDVGVISVTPLLNEAECGYGIEAAYRSEDGHLGIAQLILVFATSGNARQAEEIDFSGYKFAPDSGYYDTDMEVYGISEANGRYLVITVGAIDTKDETVIDDAQTTLSTFHSDHALALLW